MRKIFKWNQSSKNFLKLIYKKGQINLIEKYLQTVEDISEKQLIQALNINIRLFTN